MLLTILLSVLISITVGLYLADRPIPTPVPRHLAQRGRNLSSDGLGLTIYRMVLVVIVLGSGLFALLANPSGLVAFFAAGVFLWIFMDDLQKTLIDIWNFEFWVFRP